MTLNIELTPEQAARLIAAARQQGMDPTAMIQKLVADHLPPVTVPVPDAENQALIALLDSWSAEDATDDPQELERRDAQTKELMSNLAANRLTLRIPEI